jgi:hypothetical protein
MRLRHLGVPSALLLLGSTLAAQTPTNGPSPTPTPPNPMYQSDVIVANTITTGNQRRPAVAAGTDNRFLVAWQSDATQAGFFDIKAQLFDRNGVKVGGEFQVDQAGANRIEYSPDMAGANGTYIVVWADFNQTVTDSEIWMRRYDTSGNPLGGAVQVNTFTTGRQQLPAVAAAPGGQFVVVWESIGQDGSGAGVFGQAFGADGNPSGTEFAVNTYTTGDQDRADVDMDADGFTVAFEKGDGGIAARDFGLGGSDEYDLFASGSNPQALKLQAQVSPGNSATAFFADDPSHNILGIIRRGSTTGPQFQIASGSNPYNYFYFSPNAARNVAGDAFIVTWGTQTTAPPTEYGSRGQRFYWDSEGQTVSEAERGFINLPGGSSLPIFERNTFSNNAQFTAGRGVIGGGEEAIGDVAFDPGAESFANYADDGLYFRTAPSDTVSGAILANLVGDDLAVEATLNEVAPLRRTLAPATASSVVITDATADYGNIAAGDSADCTTTGDCYVLRIAGDAPGAHWDEAVTETLSTGLHKTWLLHVAGSFADVPETNLFVRYIENLLHNGITAGGACGGYCPLDGVKRQQMAVFLLKSRFGATFTPPPATGTIFTDVPLSNPFAAWIEALFLLGITGGCSGGPPPAPTQFCPDAIVNRQQMSVFLLKTLEGSAYLPADPTGIFTDVPVGNPFARWIEELYNRQVTGGCVPSPLQYCPLNPTNRQQMAAFLVKTFGLLLYGP